MSKAKKKQEHEEVSKLPDDDNVVFLDTFTEIPDPKFPLGEVGTKTYQERCGVLLRAGLLTVNTKDLVETLALADDLVAKSIANGGKNFRAAAEMKRAALLKLDKINADQVVVSPGQGKSAFAKFGFAKRARQRHQNRN